MQLESGDLYELQDDLFRYIGYETSTYAGVTTYIYLFSTEEGEKWTKILSTFQDSTFIIGLRFGDDPYEPNYLKRKFLEFENLLKEILENTNEYRLPLITGEIEIIYERWTELFLNDKLGIK